MLKLIDSSNANIGILSYLRKKQQLNRGSKLDVVYIDLSVSLEQINIHIGHKLVYT